jgi:hypothetical protein
MKRVVILSVIPGLFALCRPAWALVALEPGYSVQTYAIYSGVESMTYSMAFDSTGNLYLDQPYDSYILCVTPDGTASVFVSGLFSSGFDWTGGTAYGDYLYTTTQHGVAKIATDGSISDFASGLPAPSEAAVDRTGNYGGYLYISTGGQDHIYRVSTSGVITMFTNWPGWTDGGGPTGLEFDTIGDYGESMYVATYFRQSDADRSGLFVLDPAGNASRFSDTLVAGLEIGFDTTGLFGEEMFVVGKSTWDDDYSIWRVSPDGMTTEFAKTTNSTIASLVFGPDGAMYVAENLKDLDTVRISRVIPEPATVILLGLGALGLFRRRQSS